MKKHKASKTSTNDEKEAKRKKDYLWSKIDGLSSILGFKGFLSASFEPKISDAEIVICFIDVRGFTDYCRKLQREMQDRKIQNFLRNYGRIFNEALLTWHTEHLDPNYAPVQNKFEKLRHACVPTCHKNLGDGMMIIWEIPSELELESQGLLAQQIVIMMDKIKSRFYFRFRNLAPTELDSYSSEVLGLEIGISIAKGHAWKLDYGAAVDYAGSVVNLASRLNGVARPKGLVALYDTSPWVFDLFVNNGEGCIVSVDNLKGYGTDVRCWINSDVSPDGLTVIKGANKAPEPTTTAVTPRAPSSTSRASRGRGSS